MILQIKTLLFAQISILCNVLFTSIAMEEISQSEKTPHVKKFKRAIAFRRPPRSSSQSSSMSISPQAVSSYEGSLSISSRESRDFKRTSSEKDIDIKFEILNMKQQEPESQTGQPCLFLDIKSISTKTSDVLQIDWHFFTGDQIVEALTRRDVSFIKSISTDSLNKFSKDQNDKSDAILTLAKAFDGTTKWLTSVILSEKDITQRQKLAKYFLLMGRNLYIMKNYHTTMQFVLTFLNPDVDVLFKNSGLNSLESEEFMCTFNPLKNYAQYRKSLFADNLEHTFYLPAFPIFVQDVVTANESGNQDSLPVMIQNHVERWECYPISVPNEKSKEVFDFVCRFHELLEEVTL